MHTNRMHFVLFMLKLSCRRNEMKKFYRNIINDKRKDLNWRNANFCYVSTIVFTLVLIATYLWGKSTILELSNSNKMWDTVLIPFIHSDNLHIFGNIECLVVVSLFLERRCGSIKYLFVLVLSVLLSPLLYISLTGFSGHGASLVTFFLFGVFFVEILFNFKECFLTKYTNIFTIITILLIFVLMSFTTEIQFIPFTTLLTKNHGSAFIEGLLVGAFSNLIANKGNQKKE